MCIRDRYVDETVLVGSTNNANAFIAQSSGSNDIVLTGATMDDSANAMRITYTLLEVQRVAALALSGVPGGDGSCSVSTCGDDHDEACATRALCEAETNPAQGVWSGAVVLDVDADAITDMGQQGVAQDDANTCLLYTSPSPRDKRQSRMPSSA